MKLLTYSLAALLIGSFSSIVQAGGDWMQEEESVGAGYIQSEEGEPMSTQYDLDERQEEQDIVVQPEENRDIFRSKSYTESYPLDHDLEDKNYPSRDDQED